VVILLVIVAAVLLIGGSIVRLWSRWPLLEDIAPATEVAWSDRVASSVARGAEALAGAAILVLATLGLIGLTRDLLEAGSIAGRLTALLFFVLGLIFSLSILFSRKARSRFLAAPLTIVAALQQVVVVAVLAAGAFAFLTEELARHGVVHFTEGGSGGVVAAVKPDALYWFYGWHLIDALPVSPLSTLKIEPPYDYDQSIVGALVLVYTLLVVVPLVSLAKEVLRRRRAADRPAETGPIPPMLGDARRWT
jgi:hypothetical protein